MPTLIPTSKAKSQESSFRRLHELRPYTPYISNHLSSANMNFFDLPLGIRVKVYENSLQEEHYFFRDGVPGLLKTRLQITQEAYSHCKITTTVRSEVAPLYMNNLEDIKKRVAKFKSQRGNKGIIVRLLCRPELPSDFITSMEHEILAKAMDIDTTIVYTRGDIYDIHRRGCIQSLMLRRSYSVLWDALLYRWHMWFHLHGIEGLVSLHTICNMLKEKCLRISQSDGS